MRLVNWLKKQKLKKSEVIGHYKAVFESYAGKYVLADLARHGHLEINTFVPGQADVTAFNEGRRAMVLHILNMLELNPNEYTGQYHLPVEQIEENE